MTKLTCRACADFLAEYLNGEMADDVRASFETHLDRCRNCKAYLDQYAAVIKAGRSACERENQRAAAALPEELVRAILDTRKDA
ncbi:MAG: zf-HC2 domain-containing protein [Vicinamibacterales bacterium]